MESKAQFYVGTLGLINVLLLSEVQSHGTPWNCTSPVWVGAMVEFFESVSYNSLITSLFSVLLLSYDALRTDTLRDLWIPTSLTVVGLVTFVLELSMWIVQFVYLEIPPEEGCSQGDIPAQFRLPIFLAYAIPQYAFFYVAMPCVYFHRRIRRYFRRPAAPPRRVVRAR